jgi:hypothetical protein
VPAIAISPWLPKNVNSTLFEHSSFAATVKEFFNLTSPFLNNRGKTRIILNSIFLRTIFNFF